jgi:hypothetical protein
MNIQESRQLAIDENTAPNILRQLADSTDLLTRKNIVINPNIPPDVLSKLAVEFPKEVFDNPAIDLLLLETPDLFSGTLTNVFCSLLKREVPERMIEYAANSMDERLKLSLLMNPQIPPEIFKQLSQSKSYQVQETTALHCNLIDNNLTNNYQEFVQAKIQQEILKVDKNNKEILRIINDFIKLYEHIPNPIAHYLKGGTPYLKDYSHLSYSEIEKIADSRNWQELELLGRNPNTPISILERMFANGNAYLYIANNPNLTIELIRKLLAIPNSQSSIAHRIGFNPSTPVEILEELAKSNCHNQVHEEIAVNPKTPNYILEIILNRPTNSGYVYEALGRSTNISVKLLEQLVNKSEEARIPVFNNPKTPEALKKKLLEYFKMGHYSRLSKNFLENSIVIPISKYSPQEFINNSYVPSDFLEICIEKRLNGIDKLKKPRTNLEKKSWKYQLSSLKTLAFHPNITPNSLKKLLAHEDILVRSSALANYKTPKYITEVWGMSFLENLNRDELKILAKSFYVTEELLRELVNHKDIVVSRTAASNPSVSNEILEEWETSPSL